MTTNDEILTASRLLADQKIHREHFNQKLRTIGDEMMAPCYTSEEKFLSMVGGGETWVDDVVRDRDAGACGETHVDNPVSRTGMTRTRWQYLKSVKPVATQMFVSCAPDKNRHSRATYRKSEHVPRGSS